MSNQEELEAKIVLLERKNAELSTLYEQSKAQLNEVIKIDERLGESERRFKTVFDNSSVACKIINSNLEILEVNQAVLDLLDYSREEIVGSTIRDYTRADFKAEWKTLQSELWEKQVPKFKFEVCLIKKDKTEVWCIINSILFKDNNETFGYTVLEDITERKKIETTKDEVLGIVSHELKTPLTSLKAYTQVLERVFSSESNTIAGVMLKKINIQVAKITRLIHDLLDVTRMEGGKFTLSFADYSFNELLSEVVEGMLSTASYHIEVEATEQVNCYGDRDRTEQVLINLINNGIKYSPGKNKIIVRLRRKETELICTVQDFGMGIPLKKQKKLFERYFRIDTDKTQNIAGLGLGLYISAEVIQLHNGKIWLESEEGKGSTFYFSLPCYRTSGATVPLITL